MALSDCMITEMINCHCVNSSVGASFIYLSKKYPKTNFRRHISKDSTYIAIIVLDEASITDLFILINDKEVLQKFTSKINVNLGVYLDNNQLDKIINLDSENYIRSIRIPVQLIYKYKHYHNLEVGAEQWDYFGTPAGFEVVDESVRTIISIKELMPKVEEVVNYIMSRNPTSDLEKILLLDYWMQRHVQYIKAKETKGIDGIYVCNSMECEAIVSDVLINHYGRCADIAFTAAIILNHPGLNINCRLVTSNKNNHSWNIVLCEEDEYFVDYTRNITRNKKRSRDAIQALSYSTNYTLLGKNNVIVEEYGISDIYDCSRISPNDYNQEMLAQKVTHLIDSGVIQAEWQSVPVMSSYKKEG